MSKLKGELSYKDWCILKHKLRDSVRYLEIWIPEYHFHLNNKEEGFTSEELNKLQKELSEEKATLQRVTKLTNNFKRYIKGKERHYVHRAADCE